ncbi:MAG: ATP-binding protein [Propionibacteriaceae bacterium]|nr:ATP-binding protein [Propionibacteriaceae bacterium]
MLIRHLYLDRISSYLDTPVVKVLTGVRRCGKSTILTMVRDLLLERGVRPEQIWIVTFESLAHEHLTDANSLYEEGLERAAQAEGKLYILLDEIQMVDRWERVINSFRVDLDCDIIITGSNASLLSGELATFLTGRYVEFRIHPLSFSEYQELSFTTWISQRRETARENKLLHPNEQSTTTEELTELWHALHPQASLFNEFVRFGGLPGIHELRGDADVQEQYLQDVLNSVLLKDVVSRFKIRDVNLLDRVLNFVVSNLGQVITGKRIADYLKSQRRNVGVETIYNYLDYLAQAFIIHKVSRYDITGKRIMETHEKYFLEDQGFATARLGYRPQEYPGLLENIVYLELIRRGYDVHIGKQGNAEVDFIATMGSEKIYVQVSYLLVSPEVVEREFKPLREVKDHFRKIVLSLDDTENYTSAEGIERINVRKFLS